MIDQIFEKLFAYETISIFLLIIISLRLESAQSDIKSLKKKLEDVEDKLSDAIENSGDIFKLSIESIHDDLMTDEDKVRSLVRVGVPRDLAAEHVYMSGLAEEGGNPEHMNGKK